MANFVIRHRYGGNERTSDLQAIELLLAELSERVDGLDGHEEEAKALHA
jgi:hypothetical protein